MPDPAEQTFLRRVLIVAGVSLAGVLLLSVLWHAVDALLLIFAGIILGRFLHGLATAVSRRLGWGFRASLAVVTIGLLLIVIGGTAYALFEIGRYSEDAADQASDLKRSAERWIERRSWARALELKASDVQQLLTGSASGLGAFGRAFGLLAALGAGLVIVSVIGIFFAVNPWLYVHGAIRLFPLAHRPRIREVIKRLNDTLWRWTQARLLSMSIIAVCSALGLMILGVPLPITLGMIAGVLTFIPNIGPTLALVPPVLLAMEDGVGLALSVLAFYLVLQFVETYFLTPIIEQKTVATPPALLLALQVLLAVLAGVLGVALATPLLAVTMVLVQEFYIHDVLEKEGADER